MDITTDGLMLISEEPIAVGKEYRLEVRLPNTQGDLQAMCFKAVCRWSNNDANKSFFDSGFEILEKASDVVNQHPGNDQRLWLWGRLIPPKRTDGGDALSTALLGLRQAFRTQPAQGVDRQIDPFHPLTETIPSQRFSVRMGSRMLHR